MRSAVEVHLLSLSREVILLGGRIIFPRVEVRHGCSDKAGEFCLAGSKMCCRDVGRLGLEAGGFIAGSLKRRYLLNDDLFEGSRFVKREQPRRLSSGLKVSLDLEQLLVEDPVYL